MPGIYIHFLSLPTYIHYSWQFWCTQCSSKSGFIAHEIPISRVFFPELTQFHSNTDPDDVDTEYRQDSDPQIFPKTQTRYLTWVPYKQTLTYMMTSSNEIIFRVTGPLSGPRWIPLTKASDAELNKRLSKECEAGDLRRYRARYDVTVMSNSLESSGEHFDSFYSRLFHGPLAQP